MNSWLGVEAGECVLLLCVLNQEAEVAIGDRHQDFILITERTTKRGASNHTLRRFFNNNTSFKLRGNKTEGLTLGNLRQSSTSAGEKNPLRGLYCNANIRFVCWGILVGWTE